MSHFRTAFVVGVAGLSLLAPATARANWGAPIPVTRSDQDAYTLGVAANELDRPSVLCQTRSRQNRWTLALRRARSGGALGRPTVLMRSKHQVTGGGLFAGRGTDLVAGWLEIVNGSRRPVVATGSRLQHRRVLAPGPRSTQVLRMAANRRGEAVVAFWRYAGRTYPNFAIYAALRQPGHRFRAAQPVATGNVGNPSVALDQQGNAAVAWSDRAGVHLALRSAGAAGFGAPELVASADHVQGEVGVGLNGDHVVLAWVTEDIDDNRTLLVSERTGGGPFTRPAALNRPSARIPHWPTPSVSVTPSRTLVAWVQGDRFTSAHDAAALSVKQPGGSWSAPVVRGVRGPERVYFADLLGPAPGRPPMLGLSVASRGFVFTAATATVRRDDSLGGTRVPHAGRGGAFRPLMAHGRRHTWLGTERTVGYRKPVPRRQVLLFRSS